MKIKRFLVKVPIALFLLFALTIAYHQVFVVNIDHEAKAKEQWIVEFRQTGRYKDHVRKYEEDEYTKHLLNRVEKHLDTEIKEIRNTIEVELPDVIEAAKAEVPELEIITRTVTAYSSTVAQTDSTPCISASGHNICQLFDEGVNVVATNEYPLYTKVEIDGLEYIVLDRMNKRYPDRWDVYTGRDTQKALQWGKKTKDITIVGTWSGA